MVYCSIWLLFTYNRQTEKIAQFLLNHRQSEIGPQVLFQELNNQKYFSTGRSRYEVSPQNVKKPSLLHWLVFNHTIITI